MQIGGIHSAMTPLGRVSVRLSGIVRGSADGRDATAINAPKVGDARAELDRVARVTGADKVMSVVSDYRRTALAGGPQTTQWRVEVQAWGTAMAVVEAPLVEEPKPEDKDAARKRDDEALVSDAQATRDAAASKATDQTASDTAQAPNPTAAQEVANQVAFSINAPVVAGASPPATTSPTAGS